MINIVLVTFLFGSVLGDFSNVQYVLWLQKAGKYCSEWEIGMTNIQTL